MGLVEFEIDPGNADVALSTHGNFWYQEIGPGQWALDAQSAEFEDMLVLQGRHESRGESFDYVIVLRPWGRLWDDIAAGDGFNLPFRYEWYQSQIENSQPMPERLPPVD